MAAKFDPERNTTLALPALFARYEQQLAVTKAVLQRLNGGTPLPIVPAAWTDVWLCRFLIGFKEDPEEAGAAFFAAQRWREENGLEAIRQKIAGGLQPAEFPHAAKVRPFLPAVVHGRCKHGLPVEYIFTGCMEPARMFKAATYEEILEYHIHDAEYKLNMIMTESLARNVLVRMQNVNDLRGVSMSKQLNRKCVAMVKSIADQMTPRYVEMVDKIQVINCPWAPVVKKLIQYLAPPRALHKFSVTGGEWYGSVTEHIAPEHLIACLQPGGPSIQELLGLSSADTNDDMNVEVVPAGKKVEVSAPVSAGHDVSFACISEGHDVGLSVWFEPDVGEPVELFPFQRIKGDYRTSGGFPAASECGGAAGTLRLVLDNCHSWTKKKTVRWLVETQAPADVVSSPQV